MIETYQEKDPVIEIFAHFDIYPLNVFFIYLFVHSLTYSLLTFINLFIYLFIHSFVCLFIHSFIRLFVCLFIYSFIYLFIYLFIHLFIHSFFYSFIHLFIHSFIQLFIHSFIYLFIRLFLYSFICLFIYSFIHLFIYLFKNKLLIFQDQNGIPKGIRGITNWVPSVSSIINILQHFGATPETIVPEGSNIADSMFKRDSTEQDQINQHDMKNSNDSSGRQLCSFIRQLVQLVTHAIHFGNYVENDLPLLLVIVCRLSLDVRLQELLFDLETCVSEILNCFGIAQWEEQVS